MHVVADRYGIMLPSEGENLAAFSSMPSGGKIFLLSTEVCRRPMSQKEKMSKQCKIFNNKKKK